MRQSIRNLTSLQKRWLGEAVLLIPLLLLPSRSARAQTIQFLPEVDASYRIHPYVRFLYQVKETREAGDPTQVEIGPGFDFFLKPLVRLRDVTAFDLDDAKSRPVQFSVGFRYVPSTDKPHTERMVLATTFHVPLIARVLLSDRNRADLDWSQNQFTWRYRNRVTMERRIGLGSHHPAPYIAAEGFYQNQYKKWTTTALYAGCLFPVHKHIEFDSYYEHQNITDKHPNQQLNQFGLILNLSF